MELAEAQTATVELYVLHTDSCQSYQGRYRKELHMGFSYAAGGTRRCGEYGPVHASACLLVGAPIYILASMPFIMQVLTYEYRRY